MRPGRNLRRNDPASPRSYALQIGMGISRTSRALRGDTRYPPAGTSKSPGCPPSQGQPGPVPRQSGQRAGTGGSRCTLTASSSATHSPHSTASAARCPGYTAGCSPHRQQRGGPDARERGAGMTAADMMLMPCESALTCGAALRVPGTGYARRSGTGPTSDHEHMGHSRAGWPPGSVAAQVQRCPQAGQGICACVIMPLSSPSAEQPRAACRPPRKRHSPCGTASSCPCCPPAGRPAGPPRAGAPARP